MAVPMKDQAKKPFPSGSIFYMQSKCGPMVITPNASNLAVTGLPGKGDQQKFAVEYDGESADRVAFRQVSNPKNYIYSNTGNWGEKVRIGETKQWWIPERGRPETGDNGFWLRNDSFGGYMAFWDLATIENWACGITFDTWYPAKYGPAMTWMLTPTPEYEEATKKAAAAAEDEVKAKADVTQPAKTESAPEPVENDDGEHCCSNCESCVKCKTALEEAQKKEAAVAKKEAAVAKKEEDGEAKENELAKREQALKNNASANENGSADMQAKEEALVKREAELEKNKKAFQKQKDDLAKNERAVKDQADDLAKGRQQVKQQMDAADAAKKQAAREAATAAQRMKYAQAQEASANSALEQLEDWKKAFEMREAAVAKKEARANQTVAYNQAKKEELDQREAELAKREAEAGQKPDSGHSLPSGKVGNEVGSKAAGSQQGGPKATSIEDPRITALRNENEELRKALAANNSAPPEGPSKDGLNNPTPSATKPAPNGTAKSSPSGGPTAGKTPAPGSQDTKPSSVAPTAGKAPKRQTALAGNDPSSNANKPSSNDAELARIKQEIADLKDELAQLKKPANRPSKSAGGAPGGRATGDPSGTSPATPSGAAHNGPSPSGKKPVSIGAGGPNDDGELAKLQRENADLKKRLSQRQQAPSTKDFAPTPAGPASDPLRGMNKPTIPNGAARREPNASSSAQGNMSLRPNGVGTKPRPNGAGPSQSKKPVGMNGTSPLKPNGTTSTQHTKPPTSSADAPRAAPSGAGPSQNKKPVASDSAAAPARATGTNSGMNSKLHDSSTCPVCGALARKPARAG